MDRHMSADSPGAQAPQRFLGSEIQEPESSPHQRMGTGGREKTDVLFLSKCIASRTLHLLSVKYSCGSGFHGTMNTRKKEKNEGTNSD